MKLYDDINLNRNNKAYEDIENFKDYEFTNCLAFELAIRNKDVSKGLFELLKIYKVLDMEPQEIIFSNKYIEQQIFTELAFKSYNDYLEFIHSIFLTYKYKIDLKKTIDYFIRDYNNLFHLIKPTVGFNKILNDISKFEAKPDFLNYLSMKCYYKSSSSESSNTYSYDYDDVNAIFKNSKAEHFIVQKLSRPKLTEPKNLNTNVHIMDVNLNLPIDELKSYIEDIYNYFHKTKGAECPYILNSFGLANSIYNYKLIPYHIDLIYEENSFYNHQHIPRISLNELLDKHEITNHIDNEINISKRLSKQDWADCFFIYDYYKNNNIGINEGARILEEYFNYYYYVKVESTSKSKSTKPSIKKIRIEDYYKYTHLYIEKGIKYKSYYSISTIKSRYNLMTELIDNAIYTRFIAG
ncbi:MAG: hypothetical protein RBR23_06115 [Arcobacteraceae bacterium]|jgi:hypothetical protein|nr:hypothetical protein [Arcobacteraceae bacterium]